ncbi:hypothetical protein D1872_301930 [compost metagenome]
MPVFGMLPRINFIQPHENIMLHIGVRILVNGNAGCGMRAIDDGKTVNDSAVFDKGAHFSGDVAHLVPFGGG